MKPVSPVLPILSSLQPKDFQIKNLAIILRHSAKNPRDPESHKPDKLLNFLKNNGYLTAPEKTDYLKGPESRNLALLLQELSNPEEDFRIILGGEYRTIIDALNSSLKQFSVSHNKAASQSIQRLHNLQNLPTLSISRALEGTRFYNLITETVKGNSELPKAAKIRQIKEFLQTTINPDAKLSSNPTDEQLSYAIVENLELLQNFFTKNSHLFPNYGSKLLEQFSAPNLEDRSQALTAIISADIDLGEELIASSRWTAENSLETLKIVNDASLENTTFEQISEILRCSLYSYPEFDKNSAAELNGVRTLIESNSSIYQSTAKLRSLLALTYNTPNNEYNLQFADFLSDRILQLVEERLQNIDSYPQQKAELTAVIKEGSTIFSAQKKDFPNQHIAKEAAVIEHFAEEYLGGYFPKLQDRIWIDVESETDELTEQSNHDDTSTNHVDLSQFFGKTNGEVKDLYEIIAPTISEDANFYQDRIFEVISDRILGTRMDQLEEIWQKDREGNYQHPLSRRIEEAYEIIAESSRTFQRSPDLASHEIEIIRSFISEDTELCRNEGTLPVYPVQNPNNPTSAESAELKSRSLLYSLTSAVISHSAIVLVDEIVKNSGDLSNRPDLLMTMVFDHTIAPDPDISHTFDLMVQKNIPLPTQDEMDHMLTKDRLVHGRAFSKLAKSFLRYRDDITLVDYLLKQPDRSLPEDARKEKAELSKYLKTAGFDKGDDDILLSNISYCIRSNDATTDAMLNEILTKKEPLDLKAVKKQRGPLIDKFLQKWEDHSPALVLAVNHELVKTFEMFINAGFDPRKHPKNTPNVFAIACKTQGTATLAPYLEAIKNKYGEEVAQELIQETFVDRDGKTKSALTLAIEGNAYTGNIEFLINNGADFNRNHSRHLTTAIKGRHTGTFEFLLSLRDLNDEELERVFDAVADQEDFAITESFKTYLNGTHPQMIEVLDKTSEERRQAFANQNIYEICEKYGEKTLKTFLRANPEYRLSDNINTFDQNNRSPLYYAISKNGYAAMAEFLMQKGANPNLVAIEDGVETDAATLAIRHHHPKALAAIFNRQDLLSDHTIQSAVAELTRPENNKAVLTESFIENLAIERIRNLSPEIRHTLLKKSLESESKAAVAKMKEIENGEIGTFVKQLFEEAITSSNPKMLKELIAEFDLRSICEKRDLTESQPYIESPLSITRSRESSALRDVTVDHFANKYLTMAENVDPNRENESAQAVVEIIKKTFVKETTKTVQQQSCIIA